MRIILISANGYGAGKTTLASRFSGVRTSLAYSVRKELASVYPEFSRAIFSLKLEDKFSRLPSGKTVRQELVELGQSRCKENEVHWCEKWQQNNLSDSSLDVTLIVDDLRKLVELSWFRLHYQDVTHFHLKFSGALAEKNPDGTDAFDDLEEYADYVIHRYG
jgi:hypothetical protein